MIPIIIIEGATATGKSVLALQLSQKFNTEIISADSRQVYKYLDIGTAKPTKDELKAVKHHLIDVINPDESYNAGLFRQESMLVINSLVKDNKIPIVCGGTGLYVKVLLEGLFQDDIQDKEIRKELENEYNTKGLAVLYEELTQIDSLSANKLSSNDKHRILRALEVYRSTGIPISEHWSNQSRVNFFNPFRILLNEDRATLYNRIDQRIIDMVKKGLIEEIKSLLESGFSLDNPGFNSVGYKEYKPYIENDIDLDKCVEMAQKHTRNYAKRQITWYRKCTFNLAESYSSINIRSVGELINSYFNK